MKIIHPVRVRSHSKYRALLTNCPKYDLQKGYKGRHTFIHDNGFVLGSVTGDILTINEEYTSDLASPAFRIFGKWVGTPTSERELDGVILHDFLRQTMHVLCSPWNRKDTDDLFYEALLEGGSKRAGLYHWAVSSAPGDLFLKLTTKPLDVHCTHTLLTNHENAGLPHPCNCNDLRTQLLGGVSGTSSELRAGWNDFWPLHSACG
jgi:hypothetical protein